MLMAKVLQYLSLSYLVLESPLFWRLSILSSKRLHTAQLEAQVGWMYQNYRRGAGLGNLQICRKIF